MRADEITTIGGSGVSVTRLGVGTAAFGGLYVPAPAVDCFAALRTAWQAGIRYFDTAPMYGLGRAEHFLGYFLREEAEHGAAFTLSTKVGRLMARERPGRPLPPEPPKNPLDSGWCNGLPFREVFDYSYDAILRSWDDSLQRTGLGRLDILYVHDIGPVTHGERAAHHWQALTRGGGFRALEELRAAGQIGAFGLGVNEAGVIAEAMEETRIDCALLAGRHTLLEQEALPLLDRAAREGVAIIAAGVFNSGILAATGGQGHAKFNYQDAPPAILARAARIAEICDAHGVAMPAAALQFPLRHPAVASVLTGVASAAQARQNIDWFESDLPEGLWSDLASAGIIA